MPLPTLPLFSVAPFVSFFLTTGLCHQRSRAAFVEFLSDGALALLIVFDAEFSKTALAALKVPLAGRASHVLRFAR